MEILILETIPSVQNILERLDRIFPDGIENRNYIVREMSAKTIFVMIYCMAIEGLDRWIRPSQVTNMTDEQSQKIDSNERENWYNLTLKPGVMKENVNTWYADNTREPIRDETLRYGLIQNNAVIENPNIKTVRRQMIRTATINFLSYRSSFIKQELFHSA